MSSLEFKKWKVYNRINPIGPRRTDLGFAIVAAQIMNARRTKQSDPMVQPGDFIPKFYDSPSSARRRLEQQANEVFGEPPKD